MKILKYESFLETMQFAVLSNAQKLAKQEEERRKKKREEESKKDSETISSDQPTQYHDIDMEGEEREEGETPMEGEEEEGGEPRMEDEEGGEPRL